MSSIKGFILLLVSVGVGTFVNKIMENINVNVWIARVSGCLVSVIITLIVIKFFFEKTHNDR